MLAVSSRLTAYRYEDKYVSSPLVVALLDEVLRAAGSRGRNVSGAIITTEASPRQRPMRTNDDFEGRAQQGQAIEQVIGIAPKLVEGRNARHRRELQLEWEDGTKLTVRLDHGLGFMKLQRPEGMSFDGGGVDVMRRFLEKKHELVLRDLGLAYVSLSVGK